MSGYDVKAKVAGRPRTSSREDALFAVPWLNIALFITTLFTTVVAGTYLAHFDSDLIRFWILLKYRPQMLADGLPFAVSIMAILLSHELGHYLLSRHHNVACSLPYFLPGPNLVGTFGAVIFMKSPIPDRNALFDIGAAGPLAGMAVTVFVMVMGFATAEVEWFFPYNFQEGVVLFRPNLMLYLVGRAWPLAPPEALPEFRAGLESAMHAGTIINSPLLDAACIGFLVTMLNLLPIGQLDGGHIAHAALGNRSIWLSRAFMVIIFILGYFWLPWIFMGLLLLVVMGRKGLRHPPPLNPYTGLTRGRALLAFLMIVIFILILAPVPVDIGIPQMVSP